MKPHVTGVLTVRQSHPHQVELRSYADVRAGSTRVVLELLRSSRREAKSDQLLFITPGAARDLMRQLQGCADEADRQAYAANKKSELDREVERLVAAGVR